MIRHVFKLVWNRKRSTGLILVEILICFLVLCGIMAAGIYLVTEWRKPLGFEYKNVWAVEINGINWRAEGDELAANRQAMVDLIRTVESLPEVAAAAASTNTPFSTSTWADGTKINGESVHFLWTLASKELPDVLNLELLHGRWMEETDGALNYQPVVLNRTFARDLFGMDDAVGKNMPIYKDGELADEPEEGEKMHRVVGVMTDYHRSGMMEERRYTMLIGVDFANGEYLPAELLIRVQPGTTADFEEKLVRTMQGIAPQWSYDTELIESRRRSMLLTLIGPMIISSIVAGFLIVMVGLGLVGVLWLSVTRRTAELGLRRAMGASGVSVQRQVVGELWALTTIAVMIGALIFLQLPLFGANFGAGWLVFLGGLALATLVIYAFVTFCGLYPAWLATRVQPATALQYE
jgi:putative ABC transport system permease protein